MKSAAEIREWLRAAIALELRLEPAALDARRPLSYYGLDSLTAATLSGELGDWLGREMPPDLLVEHPTIDALAEHLAAGLPEPPPTPPPQSDRPDDDRPRWDERTVRRLARYAVRASSVVEVDGREWIPASGPALFAVNHLHILDALWMSAVLPSRTRFLVADEFRTKPVVGRLLAAGRTIYIARGRADREALERAVAVVRGGGAVAIAPEGRLSRTGGLIKGQGGAAYLSSQSGTPVIPVAAYGQERAAASWTRLSRVRVRVRIGEPIDAPSSPATAHELEHHTVAIMRALARLLPPAYRGIYSDPGAQ